MASAVRLTEAEAIEALLDALPQGSGSEHARTSAELAEQMGLSVHQVKKALHALNREGRVEFYSVMRPGLGRMCRVQGYTILPKPKPRRKVT